MKDVDTVVERFVDASIKYGEAQEEGASRIVNKQSKIIRQIVVEVKRDYESTDGKFDELLKHPNNYVRLHAAFCLLSHNPKEAEAVLVDISHMRGLLGFEAEMTLQEWKKGNLK